ncbi:hypothetical protein MAR_009407 [Mya arenaria]|uniref:Uncharacterized protein n=1 Tax=Mya arenaria TaxID=6604 RepID=A0ABY7E0Y6_MYAAR|nr:hypothetical protein MAR_009407 [Mya arenaria]
MDSFGIVQRQTVLQLLACVCIAGAGEVCRYRGPQGHVVQVCPERCCTTNDWEYQSDQICCVYRHSSELYMGIGLSGLLFIALLVICSTYICCRNQIRRQAAENRRRHTNTRTRSRHHPPEHSIAVFTTQRPPASGQVEPPLPPPYDDTAPPPYLLPGETGSDSMKDNQIYPAEPPPKYSLIASEN